MLGGLTELPRSRDSPRVPFAACNCHGHAADCFYDPDVERQQASLDTRGVYAGGGVCIDCQVRRWARRGGVTVGNDSSKLCSPKTSRPF